MRNTRLHRRIPLHAMALTGALALFAGFALILCEDVLRAARRAVEQLRQPLRRSD